MDEKEIAELKNEVKTAFDFVKAVLQKEECDILILDEIMAAINTGLIDVDDVADVLRNKPSVLK